MVKQSELWYALRGPDGAPALLMLNELTANHESWQWVEPQLGDAFRRIVADTPGTGRSPLRSPATLDTMADGVLTLLDALDLETVDIVAAGYGAFVVAYLASRRPDRVSAAMLITIVDTVPEMLAAMMRQHADIAETTGLAAMADPMLAGAFPSGFAEREPEIFRAYKKLFLARDAQSFALMERALVDAGAGLADRIRAIRCPVAIVGGAEDMAFTPQHHAAVGALMTPPVKPAIVPGAAHFPWCQNPKRVAELILQFFAQKQPVA